MDKIEIISLKNTKYNKTTKKTAKLTESAHLPALVSHCGLWEGSDIFERFLKNLPENNFFDIFSPTQCFGYPTLKKVLKKSK